MPARSIASLFAGSLVISACSQSSAQQGGGDALTHLQDRIAIEDLIVGYYEHLGGSAEGVGEYYTEDAVFDVNGMVLTGRAAIRASMAGLAMTSLQLRRRAPPSRRRAAARKAASPTCC
jgi:hypothetical protein